MPGLVLPASFGRYTLLELVGGGGMASVYRAALSGVGGFEKELAVKVVRPELAIEPQFVELFLDEARLSARLGHANVVHTFDFGQVDGTWFLAMEFVRGPTLAKLLRVARARGIPLGAARTMHLAGEVARGLGYAHRLRDETGADLGLVHRDVSPQNILLSREGEVKLADFGIAKAASRSTVTRTGHVRGKCAYMAPEQARGEAIDARADVFALGVVLWECLTGQPLFDGASDGAVLLQVVQREIPPPSRFGTDVPAALDDLVLRMLSRDLSLRPANGDEVAQEVAELKLRLVRSTQETDLAAYQRELGSGTAVLDAMGQRGGAGRQQSEAIELESAAILEAESQAGFDPRAETRLPLRAESAEVTRISRPATGSGVRASAGSGERAAPGAEGPVATRAGGGTPAEPPIAGARTRRRRRSGLAAAIAAGVILVAGGAWLAARPPDVDLQPPAPDVLAVIEEVNPPVEIEHEDEDEVPPLLAAFPPSPSGGDVAPEAVPAQEAEPEAQAPTPVPVAGSVVAAASPVEAAGSEIHVATKDREPGARRPARRTITTAVAPRVRPAAAPTKAPAQVADAPHADGNEPARKMGLLVLTSTREGIVSATLDGRELVRMGPRSPQKFEVPAGRHELAFRSAASGFVCRLDADVKAGQKTSFALQAQGAVEIVDGTAVPHSCIAD